MSDSTVVSGQYGPDQSFFVSLEADGRFSYSSCGNSEPLFPYVEMGRYAGEDAASVGELRAAIAANSDASNAPRSPDTAYVYVANGPDKGRAERFYGLYAPPPGWGAIQASLLARMNGVWRSHPKRVLQLAAQWHAPIVVAANDPAPTLILDLRNTGTEPLRATAPSLDRWRVILLPNHVSPRERAEYPYEVDAAELAVVAGTHAPGTTLDLDPGALSRIALAIQRRLPPGSYDVTASYSSIAPPPSKPDEQHVAGRLTAILPALTVTPPR